MASDDYARMAALLGGRTRFSIYVSTSPVRGEPDVPWFVVSPISALFRDCAGKRIMCSDPNLQGLYLTYIAMPVDPSSRKRMTIRRAASLCGITARTVRYWREENEFREREQLARQDGLNRAKEMAKAAAAALLPQAIATLANALYDPSTPVWVRVSVALRVMTWCGAGDVWEEEMEQDRWAILLRDLHESADDP